MRGPIAWQSWKRIGGPLDWAGSFIVLRARPKKRGADCLATVCPLCQFNLDAYHAPVTAQYGPVLVPTVYFTQLMGLAFGLPDKELGGGTHVRVD